MKKIQFYIALLCAKIAKSILRLTGFNATHFPGALAIKICPDFIKYVDKPKEVIAVTGTNGKTTVTNIIVDIFKAEGKRFTDNRLGSNTITGIVTALINAVDLSGVCKYETGIFEIDERSSINIFPYLKPNYMIVTNLSRDSIMRNGHPEYIAGILNESIPSSTKLILNADDIISSNLAPQNERVYFGIKKMDSDASQSLNLINDAQVCPVCHNPLTYEYLRYHHIGKAHCSNCGYSSPEYDYYGKNIDTNNKTVTVAEKNGCAAYRLLNDSIFNIYNMICVVALMRELGYTHERLSNVMNSIKLIDSRYHTEKTGNITITSQMAKDRNAFACSRVFDYIKDKPGDKEIIMMMNNLHDAKKWSENTCWLYDCDFELLNNDDIKNIVVTGPRAKDYYLRLLLAGIKKEKIEFSEKETDAPKHLKYFNNDNIFVLYGTDSIKLAQKVSRRTQKYIEGIKQIC